jgi:hypothetical protein
VRFWAITITAVSVVVLFAGSQIAHDRGQTVDWYTGFGQWLGALGSFVAAGAALWISVSDRRYNMAERQRAEDQQEADLERQAGLVRVTAEMLGQSQAVGPSIATPSIGIRNRRTDRIYDIEVTKYIHRGQEVDLVVDMVNGFTVSPPRPSQTGNWYFKDQLQGLALETDEWLIIYQSQPNLTNAPADYAAVRYTDRAGRRWEVDTEGAVTRL